MSKNYRPLPAFSRRTKWKYKEESLVRVVALFDRDTIKACFTDTIYTVNAKWSKIFCCLIVNLGQRKSWMPVWNWISDPQISRLTVICETKRNEIKICNLRNGSMLMIRKVEISIVQIISIILFRKLRISALQIISIFSFSKIWNFIPRLKKIKELESVTFSQQTWYFI